MNNLDRVLEKKRKDKERRKRETEKQREEIKAIKERRDKWRSKFMKKPRVMFTYERMEDGVKLREQRDTRTRLEYLINKKYEDQPFSKIPLSTELYLKYFNGKRVLKYKVLNVEWEEGIETRTMKNVLYTPKMFKWLIEDTSEYGVVEESF